MADKRYTFKISAEVMGSDGVKMFDANVNYENMQYEDVVLVESSIIKMFDGLNQYAQSRDKTDKPIVPGKR